MKLFYVISILVVAALTLVPFVLPTSSNDSAATEKIVSWYTPDGRPIYVDYPLIRQDVYAGAIKSMDPTTCGDTASGVIQGEIYDGLYTYDYFNFVDGRPQLITNLAADMPTISEDQKIWTFRIKKGVLYHRNPCFGMQTQDLPATREVKAADFILAFKRCADIHNAKVSTAWAFLSGRIKGLDEFRKKCKSYAAGDFSRYDIAVHGLEVLDDYTFRVTLNEPYPQFNLVLALENYAPCPREAVDYWLTGNGKIPLEQREVEFTSKEMAVGTGPYILKVWERKKKLVLVRNPDYREEYYPSTGDAQAIAEGLFKDAGKRLPLIDMCVYDYVPEYYTSWMLFLTGRSDASGIPPEAYQAVITPDQTLSKKWEREEQIYLRKAWTPALYWLTFNMNDPLLKASKSLRQAMCLCFDVETYINVVFNGRGRRAKCIVPQNFAGFIPGPYYRLDLELAKKKIEQAKEELRAAGLLDENGKIPVITLDSDDGLLSKRMGEFAVQQFAEIGVRLKPNMMDWPTLQERVHTKKSQMYMMGWHSDYYDAENFLQLFYSPNITTGTNNSNYSNPKFDELYRKVRYMPDSPQRTKLYREMALMVCEDCPVLPLSEPLTFVLLHNWYENYRMMPIGNGYWKFRNINPELRKKFGGAR